MERGSFRTKIGVILATAGSAVGLGNVWRFPYMTGKDGGAAFIIIYLVAILMLGIPGMVAEFVVGRNGASNAARAYTRAGGKAWGLLLVIVVASCTLPNAGKGIEYLFKPNFSLVTRDVFLDALGQAFFSLSLGTACLCINTVVIRAR
jgi:NSS family neurotransmitter:Na+ symporter